MKREEVAASDRWAIEDLYSSNEQWRRDHEHLKRIQQEQLSVLVKELKKCGTDCAGKLYEYFTCRDECSLLLSELYRYANCRFDEDHGNTGYQSMKDELMATMIAMDEITSFEHPFFLKLGTEKMEDLYREDDRLLLYRLEIDRIFAQKDHILGEEEERLLSMSSDMGQTPYEIFNLLLGADLKFEDAKDAAGQIYPLSIAKFTGLLESEDRILRQSAFEQLYKRFGQYRNTFASILAGQVKQLSFYARARHYGSAMEASLASKEIPVSIYENLIAAVHENLKHLHAYMELRSRVLGLEQLHLYDLYVPITAVSPKDLGMTYTYEEAVQLVLAAVAPLGRDYVELMQRGLEEGWVDRYENEGKQSGAYSSGGMGVNCHPLVLMNFEGNLNSVFTLAHEMGHALHSYYSNHNQPVVYSQYHIFVAEVASTCNEALLMQYLLKTIPSENTECRKYLLNYWMEQFRTTLFRQTMFAEFEAEIGKMYERGESLNADALCNLYGRLNTEYYGEHFALDEGTCLEWARIPHFYYDYYVYQYATGYSAAIALSEKILAGNQGENTGNPAAEAYKSFLKGGCSKSPVELLSMAGVDMNSAKPVTDALEHFGRLVEEFAQLTKENE